MEWPKAKVSFDGCRLSPRDNHDSGITEVAGSRVDWGAE
jgi:hypothetical protein